MTSRPVWYHPDFRYFDVIIKCAGDEMLMRPDPKTVFLIAKAIEDAAKKYGVEVFCVCVVSNHGHLVIGVPPGVRLDRFLQKFKSDIALALNDERDRTGVFFKRKKPTPILSNEAFFDRMTYTHSQAVHHDLVARAEDWPGLSSFRAVCDGKPTLEVTYLDEEAWREAGARPDRVRDFSRVASIPITPPPQWAGLSDDELRAVRRAHEQSVRAIERDKAEERRANKMLRLPEPASYQKTDPFSRSAGPPKRGRAPRAFGTKEEIAAYLERYARMLEVYTVASEQYRATGVLCPFPLGTFPPRIEVPKEVT